MLYHRYSFAIFKLQYIITDEVSSLVFLLAVFFCMFKKEKFPTTTIFWLPKSSWEQTNLWLPRVQGTGHVANPPHCLQKVPRHRIRCERLSCDLGIGTAFTNQLRLVVEISHYLLGCGFRYLLFSPPKLWFHDAI